MLSDITKKQPLQIVLSSSSEAYFFIYDKIKKLISSNVQSTFRIQTAKDFKSMLDRLNFESMFSEKWLYEIEVNNSTFKLINKHKKNLQYVQTAIFLIRCNNYTEFLDISKDVDSNQMSMNWLRAEDASYLFGKRLSYELLYYIPRNYTVDQCFELHKYIEEHQDVTIDKKDLRDIVGLPSSSTREFAFSLLAPFKGTDRSLRMQINKKSKDLQFLLSTYGPQKTANFLRKEVKNIRDIKQLYLNGEIYDRVRKVPEPYDEDELAKYNFYLKEIIEIPLSEVVYLLQSIGSWGTIEDGFEFLYRYYLGKAKYALGKA